MALIKSTLVSIYLLALLHAGIGERVCPSGWSLYGESCFKLFSEGQCWSRAQDLCKDNDAYLAKIPNEETQNFLVSNIVPDKDTNIWIGLNDRDCEGSFYWVDKTKKSYAKWGVYQPNDNYHNQDCVHIWGGYDYTWADSGCDLEYLPLCQKPADWKCEKKA